MNPLSSSKLALCAALCATLMGCASSVDTATPVVVRTPPPKNYEKTITDFLAFKIRNAPKNAEVSFGPPEPGACALDAYTTSSRGWVVPVAYFTRTGEATGKETIRINSKQYYFWFLGNTIAGVTPRIELCPGVGTSFEAPTQDPPAGAMMTTASPASATGEARREEAVGAGAPKQGASAGAKAASGQKSPATSSAKKSGTSSGNARPVKKKSTTAGDAKPI